jgi:hypothetical protein
VGFVLEEMGMQEFWTLDGLYNVEEFRFHRIYKPIYSPK